LTTPTNSKIHNGKVNTNEEELSSIASKQNVIHKKIQLWTNRNENEFAIRILENSEIAIDKEIKNFLATTNPKELYIRVVAETDYFEDLKHGWDFTLGHLVEQYKEEFSAKFFGKDNSINMRKKKKKRNNNSDPIIKLIPYNKCHYCNSEFNNEDETREHELENHV
jgi:hypothetical protein